MGQALYRQYRPKKLDEVIGQDHITITLKNAIKNDKISHAYLFTGPRGVGKTSVARILAHEVNQFDYDSDNFKLDIIEIDAASNRRIDEVRDLRDKVHISPASGRYKVYIIDEVHMLTKEAFNALLKTLEEPPAHVIFVLATTESHKLPETIVSRTQRFSFKPIETKEIIEHLKTIAAKEKIAVEDEALRLIAEHSDGSVRDSLSLLDQASSANRQVTINEVKQLLGIAPRELIDSLLLSLEEHDSRQLLQTLSTLEEQGYQPASIAKQLSERLRADLVNNSSSLKDQAVIALLRKLINVPASPSPDKLLEVTLLQLTLKDELVVDLVSTEKFVSSTESNEIENFSIKDAIPNPRLAIKKTDEKLAQKQFSLEDWPKVLETIKSSHNTLYGILRMSQPSYSNGTLTLAFKFSFHQKRISEPKMYDLITSTFKSLGFDQIKIETIVKTDTNLPPIQAKSPHVDIATISNIFGDAEVLES